MAANIKYRNNHDKHLYFISKTLIFEHFPIIVNEIKCKEMIKCKEIKIEKSKKIEQVFWLDGSKTHLNISSKMMVVQPEKNQVRSLQDKGQRLFLRGQWSKVTLRSHPLEKAFNDKIANDLQ